MGKRKYSNKDIESLLASGAFDVERLDVKEYSAGKYILVERNAKGETGPLIIEDEALYDALIRYIRRLRRQGLP
jgi:hypothetical protein